MLVPKSASIKYCYARKIDFNVFVCLFFVLFCLFVACVGGGMNVCMCGWGWDVCEVCGGVGVGVCRGCGGVCGCVLMLFFFFFFFFLTNVSA